MNNSNRNAARNQGIARAFARSFPRGSQHLPKKPVGFVWPVITADQAVERCIDPMVLHNAADWCLERSRGGRVARFMDNAKQLSAVAFEVRRRMNLEAAAQKLAA